MKKKVLIISYSYPPSNAPAAQRPYSIAKYLDKSKFDVTVITCGNPDSSLGFNNQFDPKIEGVRLIKVNSLIGGGVSTLRKSKMDTKGGKKNKLKSIAFDTLSKMVIPDRAIFWYLPVKKFLKKNKELIERTDIIFTTSPAFSNHLVGRHIKSKNNRVTWISELRDFHYLEHFQYANGVIKTINGKLEKSIIKNADKVVFISHSMRKIYADYYKKEEDKFSVVYNGFDLSDFKDLIIEPTNNNKLTIFYAGSFYRGIRSPFPLLQILDQLLDIGFLSAEELEIKIAGNFENDLLEELKKYKSHHTINFIGNISRAEVLEHLVKADLLWLIVGNKPNHYTGVPIKLFEYLGARRPIINFAPGISEPSRIIEENQLGWNFDTTDFDLEKAVACFEQIIGLYKTGKLSEPIRERKFPEFDREEQGKEFGELFI